MPRHRMPQEPPQELVNQIAEELGVVDRLAAKNGWSTEEYEAQLYALITRVRQDAMKAHRARLAARSGPAQK